MNGEIVLGAAFGVGVVHQGQVTQGSAPLGGALLLSLSPQQTYSHISGVVVLKGDFLNLQDK